MLTSVDAMVESGQAEILSRSPPGKAYFPPVLEAFHDGGEIPDLWWRRMLTHRLSEVAPLFLASLHDVFLLPTGVVVTADGRILRDSLLPFAPESMHPDTLAGMPRLPDGRVDVTDRALREALPVDQAIHGRELGEGGYYHLMTSVVPRILYARQILGRKAEDLPVLYEYWTRALTEAAEVFGFAPQVRRNEGRVLLLRELFFPSASQIGDIHFTRSPELLNAIDTVPWPTRLPAAFHDFNGRLFVSRRDAPSRALGNEDEVYAAVAGSDLRRVENSALSLAEQIALFAGSHIAIGAHGAGMANIIFMKPASVVVEILSPDRIWPSYRVLATLRNLRYVAILGRKEGGSLVADADLVGRIAEILLADRPYYPSHGWQWAR